MINKRYLGCQHVFCLTCLEHLQQGSHVKCPICRTSTTLGTNSVTTLPEAITDDDVTPKTKARVVKKITVSGFATSAFVDEKRRRILVATNHNSAPIQIFTYKGDRLGVIDDPNLSGLGFSITMDTKRDRIVTTTNTSVHVLDCDGQWLWSVTDFDARFNDLCYDYANDKYLFVDREKKRMAYVDPETRYLGECGDEELNCPWAVGSRTYHNGKGTAGGATVVNDFGTRTLRFINGDREHSLKARIDVSQSVFGQLSHVCGVSMDKYGEEALLCDSGHRRIVKISVDGVWQVVVGAEEFGFEIPHDVHMSDEGLMVVTSFIERGVDRSLRDSTVYIIDGFHTYV